jgi:ABC-2 type transport system ATP-binding protein
MADAAAPLTYPTQGIVVTGLSKSYGSTLAVDDVSFRARPGEVLGLLGPNGAGKTTTLLCVAGLLRPDSGTIELNGAVLGSERGRLIALISETPEVYGLLTVWEHLTFVARSCGLDNTWRAHADDLISRLGLGDHRSTLGKDLSKGLRQKTLIAASLLAGTGVVILDEPMIGLDPAGQHELEALIGELAARGVIVILSTHLLDSASKLCTHLLLLRRGHAVATGALKDLLDGKTLDELYLEFTS